MGEVRIYRGLWIGLRDSRSDSAQKLERRPPFQPSPRQKCSKFLNVLSGSRLPSIMQMRLLSPEGERNKALSGWWNGSLKGSISSAHQTHITILRQIGKGYFTSISPRRKHSQESEPELNPSQHFHSLITLAAWGSGGGLVEILI